MNEEVYIKFENYISGQMSQEEKNQFENELKNDADFREKFEIYKEVNGYLESKFSVEAIDFKKNLKQISNQNFKAEKPVFSLKPWHYAVAASLILFLSTWIFMQNNVPTYNDYAIHQTAIFSERGEVIKNLKLAEKAFNSKNYKAAITNFEIVLKEYNRPEIKLYYGISLLEDNRFIDAENIFNELNNEKSSLKNKAIWYLALSNLKQKKYNQCKNYIQQISEDAEEYHQAQKLLKELD